MKTLTVRKITINDIYKLQNLGKLTFSEAFSGDNNKEDMEKYLETNFSIEKIEIELQDNNSFFYFAEYNEKPIGYLKLNSGQSQTEIKTENSLEIERIYVLEEFHGKRIGQLLFEKALEIAQIKNVDFIWLGVWEYNTKAINFYKKNGFIAFDKHVFKLGNDLQTDIMMKLEFDAKKVKPKTNQNMIKSINHPCIAILYLGDMGQAIAKELISANFRVITASNGRSTNTVERIKNTKIEDVETIENIVKESDYIFSLTNAEASIEIAEIVALQMTRQNKYLVFVDMNSNNPQTASKIQEIITHSKGSFINAAILGNSNKISTDGKIIVSGKNTEQFINIIRQVFQVKNVGTDIGSASAFKLLFAMVNKSINGLFFETMIAASHYGFIDELNNELERFLPGTFQDLVKTTPTYPQHLKRRITEMDELVNMLKSEELPFHYALSAQEIFEQIDKEKIVENKAVNSVRDVFNLFKK